MWVVFAVLSSLCDAFCGLGKQSLKLSPKAFILYRGYIPAILALPFLFIIPMPKYWQFYALCILQGSVIAYHDFIHFKAIKKYGAEVVSSIMPLSTGLLFVLWLVIVPETMSEYWADKKLFIMISLSLLGIIFSVYKYNQHKACCRALKYMWSVLLASLMINIVNKITTKYGAVNVFATGIAYSFMTSLVVAIINTFTIKGSYKKLKRAYKQCNWKIVILFVLLLFSVITKNMAMSFAANPAYVAAIIYLSILWTIIGNYIIINFKLGNKYPQTKWRYVALLVISSAALILLTN